MAIAVDLNHEAQVRSPAHLQIELGRSDLRIYSLFGYTQLPYPKDYVVPINFLKLKPWWGAWAPNILGVMAALVLLALLIVWAALATLYCLPVWLLGLYLNRDLTLWGSWRLAGVALLPGALVMTVGIGLYGLGELDPVRLLAAFLLHFVTGWAYLALGAFAAPEIAARLDLKVNPFGPPVVRADEKLEKSADDSPRNPFRPSDD